MANLSDVYGEYTFNFTKTNIAGNAQAKKAFIIRQVLKSGV